MINYIGINNKITLPKFWDLVNFMWQKGLSISYVKVGDEFSDCNSVNISWDKWVDNPNWGGKAKSVEHIDIDIYAKDEKMNLISEKLFKLFNIDDINYIVCIETSDDAVTMDRRAFNRAIYFIAQNCAGSIFDNNQNKLINSEEYYNTNRFIIEKPFDMSVE